MFCARTVCVVVFLATLGAAQDVIPLYARTPPGSTQENYPEKEYFSKIWNTDVVANVTKPDNVQTLFRVEKWYRVGDLPGRRFYGPLHH